MATASLRPVADVVASTWVTVGGAGSQWASLDDDPDSPNNADLIESPAAATVNSNRLQLGPIPTDIATVTAVQIRTVAGRDVAGDDTLAIFCSVVDAAGSTIWSPGASITRTSNVFPGAAFNFAAGSGTGAQDQGRWNDAHLAMSCTYTVSMASDGSKMQVSAIEVNITYTAVAPAFAPPPPHWGARYKHLLGR